MALVALCLFASGTPGRCATFTVVTTSDGGPGSLRQAILDANANSGLDTINFQVPGTPPYAISPTWPLPALTDPVVLDAATQPGYMSQPVVELIGTAAGVGTVGLRLGGGGSNTVRGLAINRFDDVGIRLESSGNVIQGNYIGTDITGTVARGNGQYGVFVWNVSSNLIGGEVEGAGNIISGNTNAGVWLVSAAATNNSVQGNSIGTDSTGRAALRNLTSGVQIEAPRNLIGGSTPSAGNLIGTRADGISPLANGYIGIEVNEGCSSNTIGGLTPGSGNRIAFNGSRAQRAGVRIRTQSTNNAVLGNSIFSNTSLGIAFSGLSVTANDPCDGDGGGNLQQNFPVLTQAYGGANTGVRGYLNSRPNTTYRLQFLASPACDSEGNGEGQVYLGDAIVTAGGSCSNNFAANFPGAVPVGHVITATATDPANNTSEFSACCTVASPPSLNISAVTGGQVSLPWTNTAVGFTLKETEDLSPPIQWSPVTNAPVHLNGQLVVTLPAQSGNRFYLLNFQ